LVLRDKKVVIVKMLCALPQTSQVPDLACLILGQPYGCVAARSYYRNQVTQAMLYYAP
jgi:hypothetical protein